MSQDFVDVVEIKNGFAYQSILSVLSTNFFAVKCKPLLGAKKKKKINSFFKIIIFKLIPSFSTLLKNHSNF